MIDNKTILDHLIAVSTSIPSSRRRKSFFGLYFRNYNFLLSSRLLSNWLVSRSSTFVKNASNITYADDRKHLREIPIWLILSPWFISWASKDRCVVIIIKIFSVSTLSLLSINRLSFAFTIHPWPWPYLAGALSRVLWRGSNCFMIGDHFLKGFSESVVRICTSHREGRCYKYSSTLAVWSSVQFACVLPVVVFVSRRWRVKSRSANCNSPSSVNIVCNNKKSFNTTTVAPTGSRTRSRASECNYSQ